MQGAGRVVFAAIMLLILGTLNVIYGIGALGSASVYSDNVRLVISDLNTYGWILIILGVFQFTGGVSLMAGNAYGRIIGIIGGSVGAVWALISIAGANPWWSLAVFFLSAWIVWGIIIYGEEEEVV
jgi:hypothetical protein